jgi:cyclic beta-1,2-glucan synthetase
MGRRVRDFVLRHPGPIYAAGLVLCGLAAMLPVAWYLAFVDASAIEWLAALAAAFIPATILAVTAVNWAVTRGLPPHILPKLACGKGLPKDCATVIAMPVIVTGKDEAAGIAEQMETHWLANADSMLQVALLADLADADEERKAGDAAIIAALDEQVRALNRRHGKRRQRPFHLLVRGRQFNRSEGCWMAWERKRGKLEQFNRLLIERDSSPFAHWTGRRPGLEGMRFVVTVDADTMLPPGSVARLVGTLAHPLNRARFDEGSGRIVSGYSIIQPRVEISPQSGRRSLFTRLFTGDTAIDIYSRAVSDVYQDLFGAGIFVGKGIYDLVAFHRSVDGRVPENSILSHDLFEGAHAKVGLATDIVIYEGFPANYLQYARRLHRWIRGDWQLLPWIGRHVPAADGSRLESAFAGVDRWKILDNVRRSLVPPSLLVLAIAGWVFLPGASWFWTLLAILAPAGQLFADLVSGLARGRRRGTVRGIARNLSDQAGRWLLAIVFLMHEALVSLHAIAVTLWRVGVSHRRLLEWTSAAQVAANRRSASRRDVWTQMWPGSAAALSIGLLVFLLEPSAIPAAAPLLLLWLAAPEIALWIGRPPARKTVPLDARDVPFLRALARRTWLYFETFAGPEDNWLPPDNYQGEPHEEIAHRTSPTNVGMMLLSTATAWDLGYIGRIDLAARTENAFDSLDRLERHRGHFFNWYDTQTLLPLEPRYLSAVDSGNLAGSLVAFASALEDAASSSGLEPQQWDGLDDVIGLLLAAASRIGSDDLKSRVRLLRGQIAAVAADSGTWLFGLSQAIDEDLPEVEAMASEAVNSAGRAQLDAARELEVWLGRLRYQLETMVRDLGQDEQALDALRILAGRASKMADAMDFAALYDRERRLLFIGHNLSSGQTDQHYYDLLASEARLASFFAIAKRDLPLEHWFHLDRPVMRSEFGLHLLSWNGSIFEYLMPGLLLRTDRDSLLGESDWVAVNLQRRYGKEKGVPWGISESAYAQRDADHRYRYSAFGVPGLGLKRGLADDLVVAPYASALALAIAPGWAAANLRALDRLGATGLYGQVEAVDFTPERVKPGERFALVSAWMAHHQGMILCAIGNALTDDALVSRFGRDSRARLVSLLLSERIPREIPSEIERIQEAQREPAAPSGAKMPTPWKPDRLEAFPQSLLLGNGQFASWISDSGGGGLRWRGEALTRFVPDSTRDSDGLWIYIADRETDALWSATRQPTQTEPVEAQVVFHAHMAEFHRRDDGINTRLEVWVAAGDDLELRRLVLVNETGRPRRLRVTSYAEVVLAPQLDDERHPAFSKLFVGSEHVSQLGGLLFSRRPRSPREAPPVLLHFLVGEDGPALDARFESDRSGFLGRWGDAARPRGAAAPLENGAGFTFDPVMSLQSDVELEPYQTCTLCFVTVAAPTREAALEVGERYATLASLQWAVDDAASEAARTIGRAGLDPDGLGPISNLASRLVYPHGLLRARSSQAGQEQALQPQLWGLGLSGDLPILLVRSAGSSALFSQLVRAHSYWRRQGLETDLVLLETAGSTYSGSLRTEIDELLRASGAGSMLGRRGGIHLLFADQIGPDQARLIDAAARVVLEDGEELGTQLDAVEERPLLPFFLASLPADHDRGSSLPRREDLLFGNGLGGFSADGREYLIHLEPGATTPAPWANVLANDEFGTLLTEGGGGYTWAVNSGENRLTPWTNDPVSDRPVEALYLRDEETGAVWTVTPLPAGRDDACEVRHGPGYTGWRSHSHGLEQEMLVTVPLDSPVKLVRLRIRNLTTRHRRITSTYYVEWLLGALSSVSRPHVMCAHDAETDVLLAVSHWSPEFAGRAAFCAASRPAHGFTTDRREFLGEEGSLASPAALSRWGLSGRIVSGQDPCAAYQVHHDLEPNGADEVVFILGQGADQAAAAALAKALERPWGICGRSFRRRGALGRDSRRGGGGNARCRTQPAGQPLADLSVPCRQSDCTHRFLPVKRRLRLSRPAPGRACPAARGTGACARPYPRMRAAPVRGGRCPALVASAFEPRSPYALFRRSCLASLCRRDLCQGDWGPFDPRGTGAVPHWRAASSGRRGSLFGFRAGHRDRTSRRSHGALSGTGADQRSSRDSAHGSRRLERRHEPRRPGGTR